MKQFISETQDLVFREFNVSSESYESMVERFGNEQDALYALEYQIRKRMRDYKKANKEVRRTHIKVAFHPIIEDLFLDYAHTYNLTLDEAMQRMIRCTRKKQ